MQKSILFWIAYILSLCNNSYACHTDCRGNSKKKKSFDSGTVINKHTVTSLISLKIYWPHHDTILKRESRLWGPKIFIQIFSQNIHPIFNNARMRYQWEVWYILEIEENSWKLDWISLCLNREGDDRFLYTKLFYEEIQSLRFKCLVKKSGCLLYWS